MFINTLEEYYKNGLLTKQTHPEYDLHIWNYTPKVQIDGLWDDITLQCRGLITNTKGDIIARCIPKFFNIEEHNVEDIPNEPFEVTEKMDGSYLNIFYYDNKWLVSSRGSFTSDQAVWGTKLLKKYNVKKLSPEWSYVSELIVPENRIVVDYGNDEKIIMITKYNVNTGEEGIIDDLADYGFDVVKKHDYISEFFDEVPFYKLKPLKDIIDDNAEGFVVRFNSGFRVKIKGEEYLRLHKILTNTSTRDIWRYAKEGKTIDDILVDVPDEFYVWARSTYDDLVNQFLNIKNEIEDEFWLLIDRKEFANKIKDNKRKHLLFKRLTSYSEQFDNMIWDLIYPGYYKPFSNKNYDDEEK